MLKAKLNDAGVRKYVAVAAFCAKPLERVTIELLKDDRFFLRGSELRFLQDEEAAKAAKELAKRMKAKKK